MKTETANTMNAGVKIGALTGGVLFLVAGLVPAFYLSSFGTLTVLTAIAGGPLAPGIAVRAALVVGSVAGICAAGALSMAAGAVTGSALGYLAEALTRPAEKPAEAEKTKA